MEERQQGLEPMRKAVARLVFQQQSRCFSAWQERWAGDRAMRQALRHLLDQGLMRGFASFIAILRKRRVILALSRRSLGHLFEVTLRSVWTAWAQCCEQQSRRARVLMRGLRLGLSFTTARAWGTWLAHTSPCSFVARQMRVALEMTQHCSVRHVFDLWRASPQRLPNLVALLVTLSLIHI